MFAALARNAAPLTQVQQQDDVSRAVSQDTSFTVSREVEDVRRQVSRALGRGAILEARRALRRSSLSIPLGPARAVEKVQARRDVGREPCIYLNGVRFAGPEDVFLETLHRVVGALGGDESIAEEIVTRAARTSAGADSYFVLHWLLGVEGSTYVVMPRTRLMQVRPFSEVDDSDDDDQRLLRGLEIALRKKVLTTYSADRTTLISHSRISARIACRNSYAVLDMASPDDTLSSTSSAENRRRHRSDDSFLRTSPQSSDDSDDDADERLAVLTTVIEDIDFDPQGFKLHDRRSLEIALDGHRPLQPSDDRPSFWSYNNTGSFSSSTSSSSSARWPVSWSSSPQQQQQQQQPRPRSGGDPAPQVGSSLDHHHTSLDHPPLYRTHVVTG